MTACPAALLTQYQWEGTSPQWLNKKTCDWHLCEACDWWNWKFYIVISAQYVIPGYQSRLCVTTLPVSLGGFSCMHVFCHNSRTHYKDFSQKVFCLLWHFPVGRVARAGRTRSWQKLGMSNFSRIREETAEEFSSWRLRVHGTHSSELS